MQFYDKNHDQATTQTIVIMAVPQWKETNTTILIWHFLKIHIIVVETLY